MRAQNRVSIETVVREKPVFKSVCEWGTTEMLTILTAVQFIDIFWGEQKVVEKAVTIAITSSVAN